MPRPPKPAVEKPLPKSLGACADLLYATRELRLAKEREAEAIGKEETRLRNHLIQQIDKRDEGGVVGKVVKVLRVEKDVPVVKDWDSFYKYIKRTGRFEFLNKALGKAAVKEMWDAGKTVPGVEKFNDVGLSVTKL